MQSLAALDGGFILHIKIHSQIPNDNLTFSLYYLFIASIILGIITTLLKLTKSNGVK